MALASRLTSLARLGQNKLLRNTNRLLSLTSLQHGKIIPYKLADIGEGIREVVVKEWFVKTGDKVNQFDNICEVQSDKASVTITSRYDGIVKNIRYKVEDTVLVGEPFVDIEVEDEKETEKIENPADLTSNNSIIDEITNDNQNDYNTNKALATPAVRKIAKENKIDINNVAATGKAGRVLKEDILAYLNESILKNDTNISNTTNIDENIERVPLKTKKYAKHMWKSMTQALNIPHFVYSDECDITKLVKIRSEVKEAFECLGLKLSYMPFFLKAISRALLQFPELNGWIDDKTESVEIKKNHNISIAMDTPGGLVVPNIKNVQNLSIVDIAKELNRLQELGKKSLISPNDLTGGTFSISNIGIIGGTYTKPVILSPQIVIGAIGKVQKLPRIDHQDNIVVANILTVSWAADHRVVDGVTVAKFSNLWKYYLENPTHLIIGV